jgi:hypothetical protein
VDIPLSGKQALAEHAVQEISGLSRLRVGIRVVQDATSTPSTTSAQPLNHSKGKTGVGIGCLVAPMPDGRRGARTAKGKEYGGENVLIDTGRIDRLEPDGAQEAKVSKRRAPVVINELSGRLSGLSSAWADKCESQNVISSDPSPKQRAKTYLKNLKRFPHMYDSVSGPGRL